jgi:acyl carrier protein
MSTHECESFEEFQALLADLLQLDEAQITPDAYFVTDLGVDSLRMFRLLFHLEDLGIDLPVSSALQIQTVEDAFSLYLTHRGTQG